MLFMNIVSLYHMSLKEKQWYTFRRQKYINETMKTQKYSRKILGPTGRLRNESNLRITDMVYRDLYRDVKFRHHLKKVEIDK